MDKEGNIEKYINNPIIDGAPADMTGDIRDPFVFRKDEKYYNSFNMGHLVYTIWDLYRQ